MHFTAAPGERNALTVSAFGGVVLTDANAPIAPGSGCQRGPSTRQVVCASAGVVEADLGDRADTLSVEAGVTANVIARGHDGDDVLHAGPSVDRLEGGAGNDRLDGAGSGDDLIGGAGTDTADYSARTLGGDGRDKVDYSDRTSPLTITLDGVANDGAPGENDVLDSIQDIDGGQGSDTLVGTGTPTPSSAHRATTCCAAWAATTTSPAPAAPTCWTAGAAPRIRCPMGAASKGLSSRSTASPTTALRSSAIRSIPRSRS